MIKSISGTSRLCHRLKVDKNINTMKIKLVSHYLLFRATCQRFKLRVCLLFSYWSECLSLFDPMGCSMPGLPVLLYLLEFVQTHSH